MPRLDLNGCGGTVGVDRGSCDEVDTTTFYFLLCYSQQINVPWCGQTQW